MTRVLALAVLVALGACGADEPDLKRELQELSQDLRGRVDPLPQVSVTTPAPYGAAGTPDPFYPAPSRKR